MSFAQQSTESADSAANNDENDDFAPQPVTSRYLSLQTHLGLLKDAIGAVESFTMEDTDLPAVKWAKAIEAALYEGDECLGAFQKTTPYTTAQFKEQHGDSITTDHADLTDGERTELKNLFKNAGKDVSDLEKQFKLPVVNGDRLPLLVADEDVLSEAMDDLETMLTEFDNDAGSTTDEVDDEFTGWDAPMIGDGMPSPKAFTVNELTDDVLPTVTSPENCRLLLEAEKNGKARVTAIDAIESHGNDLAGDEEWQVHSSQRSTTDEGDDETDDETDNDTSSTTDDVDPEELAETVSKAVTAAVLEALDN